MEEKRTRTTTQRIKILEFLQEDHSHPNAEEIYQEVKESLPSITLATVYRNLHFLVEKGLVRKIRTGGKWRFDGQLENHQHLIDTETGELHDVKKSELSQKILKETDIPGFEISSVHITFYGKKIKKETSKRGKKNPKGFLAPQKKMNEVRKIQKDFWNLKQVNEVQKNDI